MNKVFKIGLIGCGHIAETYFRGHQYFNNFKIVACADINQKAADKCAKLYNIKSETVNNLIKDKERNGIIDFMRILQQMDSVELIEFGLDDIVRSGLCKEYLTVKLAMSM